MKSGIRIVFVAGLLWLGAMACPGGAQESLDPKKLAAGLGSSQGAAVIWDEAITDLHLRPIIQLHRPSADRSPLSPAECLATLGLSWQRRGLCADSPIILCPARWRRDVVTPWTRVVAPSDLTAGRDRDGEILACVFPLVNVDVLEAVHLVSLWLDGLPSWSKAIKSANTLVVVGPGRSLSAVAQVLARLELEAAKQADALKLEAPDCAVPPLESLKAETSAPRSPALDMGIPLADLVARTWTSDDLVYSVTFVPGSMKRDQDLPVPEIPERKPGFERHLQERLLASGFVVAKRVHEGVEYREIYAADDGAPDRSSAPLLDLDEVAALVTEPALLVRAVFEAGSIRRDELHQLARFFLGTIREIAWSGDRQIEVFAPVEGVMHFKTLLAAVQAAGGRPEVTQRLARRRDAAKR